MKKLLFLFAFILFSCSSDDDSSQEEVPCNCIKTSYFYDLSNFTTNINGTEKVPCQNEETRVVTSRVEDGEYYYTICCSNLDNGNFCD